jgi:hypothetical protein
MASKKEAGTGWKTKMMETSILGTKTGKMGHAMICMNSKPELSKYSQAAPEDGVCDQWVFTGVETASVLCSNCVQRLMQVSPNRVATPENN